MGFFVDELIRGLDFSSGDDCCFCSFLGVKWDSIIGWEDANPPVGSVPLIKLSQLSNVCCRGPGGDACCSSSSLSSLCFSDWFSKSAVEIIDFDCRLIERGILLDFDDGGSSYWT